jgi:hypothetical protein
LLRKEGLKGVYSNITRQVTSMLKCLTFSGNGFPHQRNYAKYCASYEVQDCLKAKVRRREMNDRLKIGCHAGAV